MRNTIHTVLILGLVALLAACGNQQGGSEGFGSLTFTAVWPQNAPAGINGKSMQKAPSGVNAIYVVISSGTTTLATGGPYSVATTTPPVYITGVPAGTNRIVKIQGFAEMAMTTKLYEGSKTGITVVAGTTTNAGSVAMYVASGMSGKYENAAMWTFGSFNSYATDLAIRPDGRILVTGRANLGSTDQFTTVQYMSSGAVDTTFGDMTYMASFPVGTLTDMRAEGLALQKDGRFIVAGYGSDGGSASAVIARYTANGSDYDRSAVNATDPFGANGYVKTRIGTSSEVYDVKIQNDGSIVAAGNANVSGNSDFLLLKFSPTGTFITSTTTTFGAATNESAYALALAADDTIYLAGDIQNANKDIGVAKYTAAGALISKTTVTIGTSGGNDSARAIAVQPDGKIVVAGSTLCGANTCIGLFRLTPSLALDSTFGTAGKVTLTIAGYTAASASAVKIQPDGKIITFGLADSGTRWDYAVARFLEDGNPDTSFNASGPQAGVVTTSVGSGIDMSRLVQGMGLGIQADGKILAAANARPTSIDGYALARYWNDVTTTMKAYVVNAQSTDNNVSVIDTSSATVSSTTVGGLISRDTTSPRGSVIAAISPAANRLYIADQLTNAVSVIDTINNREITTIPVGSQPTGIAIDPAASRLYVTNSGSNAVSVIDLSDNSLVTNITVGSTPRAGIAVDASRNRLYVANSGANSVSVIDTTTNTVVGSPIAVGLDPRGIGLDTSLNKLFVANNNGATGNTVSVIDLNSLTVTGTITVGTAPARIAVNSATSRAYVTNNVSNNVSVINTNTNAKITDILVGNNPTTPVVFYSAKHNITFLYVANLNDNTVSVIDVTNDVIVPWNPITLPGGSGPNGIAIAP